jgi:hypothetical protein
MDLGVDEECMCGLIIIVSLVPLKKQKGPPSSTHKKSNKRRR